MCDVGDLCDFTQWVIDSPDSTVLGNCDDETFKDILRFIDGNYMTSIKGFKIIQPHTFKNSTFDIAY